MKSLYCRVLALMLLAVVNARGEEAEAKYSLYMIPRENAKEMIELRLLVECEEPRYVLIAGSLEPMWLWVSIVEYRNEGGTPTELRSHGMPIDWGLKPLLVNYDPHLRFKVDLGPFEGDLAKIKKDGRVECVVKIPLIGLNREKRKFVCYRVLCSAPVIVTMAGGKIINVTNSCFPPSTEHLGGLKFNHEFTRNSNTLFDSALIMGTWDTTERQVTNNQTVNKVPHVSTSEK